VNSLIGLFTALGAQRGHFFVWAPVCFGIGIGWYFTLESEPSVPLLWAWAIGAAALLAAAHLLPVGVGPILIALVLAGLSHSGWRTRLVEEPVLGWRYYGAIEGRIVAIDRSQSDKVRLTLDDVVLERVPPHRTPAIVRISLHGEQGFITLEPGFTCDDNRAFVAALWPA
jgi:competence protein ComEC